MNDSTPNATASKSQTDGAKAQSAPFPPDAAGAAVVYARMGLRPIPLEDGGKATFDTNWHDGYLRDGEDPRAKFPPGKNVGLCTGYPFNGSRGVLLDVDLDVPEAFALADWFLAPTLTSGRPAKPRSHRWYDVTGVPEDFTRIFYELPRANVKDKKETILELRGNKHQTCVPPSAHEEQTEWYNWGVRPTECTYGWLSRRVRSLAIAALVVHTWAGCSSGHDRIMALAACLARAVKTARFFDLEEAEDVIRAVCDGIGWKAVNHNVKMIASATARLESEGKVWGWPQLEKELGHEETAKIKEWLGVADGDARRETNGGSIIPFKKVAAVTVNETEYGEPQFVVQGIIPVGLTLLAGKPKKGKSSLMRQLVATVATGERFLSRYHCTRCDALYFALEDNERRLKRDYARLLKGGKIPENITFVIQSPALDEGGLEHIRAEITANPKIRLVVIDTLQRVRGQRRARHNVGIYDLDSEALAPLRALAHELNVAVVVVHHFNKRKRDETDDVFDLFSGSTGLTAIPDVIIAMQRKPAENLAFLTGVGRGIDQELDIAITGDPSTLRWSYRGTADEARITDIGDQVLETLRKLGTATPTEIATAMGRGNEDRGNVGRVLGRLVQQRAVQKVPHTRGRYEVVPDQGEMPWSETIQ